MNSRYITVAVQLIFIFGLGMLALWVASFFDRSASDKEIVEKTIEEIILKRPSCPSTTEAFSDLRDSGQTVVLAEDLNTHGNDSGEFVNPKVTVVKSTGSGSQIACGYIYIRAHGSDGRPLHTEWEHPYIRPGQFGGHILAENSIIPQDEGQASEFLFNLSGMHYKQFRASTEVRQADWAALLNVSDRIQFEISLNTLDQEGVIEEVSITYQCWSPETGKVTRDCRLSVE